MRVAPAIAVAVVVFSAGVAATQQAELDAARRQQAAPREPRQVQRGAGEQRVESAGDRMFAECLAIDNAAEVQVAEFALQRLQDERAKQFAQQMIRDHQALLEKLTEFGAGKTAAKESGPAPGDANAAQPPRRSSTGDDAVARSQARSSPGIVRGGEQADFVAIKREIAEQCVQTAQDELSTKPAGEVDRCYLGSQIWAHQHMLAALKVLERHATPQFGEVLQQAAQTTEQHLAQAKAIMKELDAKLPQSSPDRSTSNQ